MKVDLVIDKAAIQSIKDQLAFVADGSSRGAGRVVARAINTVAGRGAKRVKREITRVMYVRQAELPVKVYKATYSRKWASIRIRDRAMSLSKFKAVQDGDGALVKVFKGEAPIRVKSAFIEQSKYGEVVYKRKTKRRYPIEVQRATPLVEVINTRTPGMDAIVGDMTEDLAKEINRGIRWELVKAQKAARKILL